jgi:hypothetical protein
MSRDSGFVTPLSDRLRRVCWLMRRQSQGITQMVVTEEMFNNYKDRIDEAKRIDLLEVHIPARLRELGWCAAMANLARVDSGPLSVDLCFGTVARCRLDKLEWISFPAFDVGILMCRALLEFLGVAYGPANKSRHEPARLEQRKLDRIRADDVCLMHFGLPLITEDEAVKGDDAATNVELLDALLSTLRAGHKGIAHLTSTRGRDLRLEHLEMACRQVVLLIRRHLYERRGKHLADSSWEVKFERTANNRLALMLNA